MKNKISDIIFCTSCVESNQRFVSSISHEDSKNKKRSTTSINNENKCFACRYYEKKIKINWKKREEDLGKLCDKFRSKDGSYDILTPGSGGKDSVWVSHIMKNKYNMNPLTITWAPHMYTDIGWKNYKSWVDSGFDNYLLTPNPKVHRILTRLAFKNLLHPFQPFAMGQTYLPVQIALEKKIKFIIYGDAQAEKCGDDNLWNEGASLNPKIFTYDKLEDLFFGGVNYNDLGKHGISKYDIKPYLPIQKNEFKKFEIHTAVLPYYMKYNPQDNFYLAKEKTNFQTNSQRTDGTYSKYSSIDDKMDDLHHYTWFIKTGRGRCTEDACLEIRNKIITREEGISLVKKYDGEFPKTYINDILKYLNLDMKEFENIIDSFRPKHLWKKENGVWSLKKPIWEA